LLGHGSVATTAIYTRVDTGDLAAIIADVNTPDKQVVE
jgi:site-specific recombinase XerD